MPSAGRFRRLEIPDRIFLRLRRSAQAVEEADSCPLSGNIRCGQSSAEAAEGYRTYQIVLPAVQPVRTACCRLAGFMQSPAMRNRLAASA